MNERNSKILRLSSENVKRLKVVEITPEGHVIVVGGDNANGKTSVLDSIFYALGGKSAIPEQPVRKGEKKAHTEIELDDFIIRRNYTAGGGTSLVITNKADDSEIRSPQAMLDALVGKLSFDPLEFARGTRPEDDRRRAEVLRDLVQLDFTALDDERQKLYDKRTAINRDADSLKSRISALPPRVEGLPDGEVSTAEILKQQEAASKVNADNAKLRQEAAHLLSATNTAKGHIEAWKTEVEQCEKRLADAKEKLADAVLAHDEAVQSWTRKKQIADEAKDVDLTPFQNKAAEVEDDNRRIRSNIERGALESKLDGISKAAEGLTQSIEALDAKKQQLISSAKFPITGLSFSDSGDVIFNGVPFSQASSAEQLRVSLAIGLALNPKLRVILIRDGSLLDDNSMKMVAEAATAADAQVWVERVGKGEECSIIIEDGAVKQ